MLPLLLLLVVTLPLLVVVGVTLAVLFGLDPPPITEEMAAARAAVKLGSAVSALTVSANEPVWWPNCKVAAASISCDI